MKLETILYRLSHIRLLILFYKYDDIMSDFDPAESFSIQMWIKGGVAVAMFLGLKMP